MKAKFIVLFILIVNIFISCEYSLNNKEVEIIIEREHPFESASGQSVWYTLSYTDGLGNINYKHLNKTQKTTKIYVKKNATIFICARALNDFSPVGGVINPGSDNRVVLNYEQGYLVSFLQDLYLQNPEATSALNYEKLYTTLKKRNLIQSFDKLVLARDLINGNLSDKSIYEVDNLSIELTQAIEGYWISENPDEGGFHISDSNYKRVSLSLGEGEHYYINIESGYIMVVIVDTRSRKYFVRIKDINPEFN